MKHQQHELIEPDEPDWNAEVTRKAAAIFAEHVVSKMFKPDAVERHLYREELQAVVIVAFEKGADWESRR